MIGPQPIVWVVASGGSVTRWTSVLESRGMHVIPLPWGEVEPPEDRNALSIALKAKAHDVALLTSAYGVRYVEPKDAEGWQAVCVGERTAAAARDRGFEVVSVGSTDATAFAHKLVDEAPGLDRILFLRGSAARDDAVHVLLNAGKIVDEVIAYQVEFTPAFGDLCAQSEDPHAIWVGSPRGVECLHHALLKRSVIDRTTTPVAAIGGTTAQALKMRGFRNILVPERVEAELLADMIAKTLAADGGS